MVKMGKEITTLTLTNGEEYDLLLDDPTRQWIYDKLTSAELVEGDWVSWKLLDDSRLLIRMRDVYSITGFFEG